MYETHKISSKIADVKSPVCTITLNVSGQHTLIKRQRLAGCMKKTRPNYMLFTYNVLKVKSKKDAL